MATAANTESLGSISDDFTCCDVCFERYQDPRMLRCGHTFCKDCLEKLEAQSGLQILCPTCRSPTPVLNNVDDLPVNYKVVELIQMVQNVRFTSPRRTEKEQECQICYLLDRSIKVATHFCASCSKCMCNTCKEDHTKTAIFEDHVFGKMPTAPEESATCKIHDSEEVKYYCQDCNLLLCTACAIQPLHRDHTTSTIEAIALKHATEIKDLKAKLITTSQEIKAKHSHLMNGQKKHLKEIRDKISKRTEEDRAIMYKWLKWHDTCMAQVDQQEHKVDNVLESYEIQLASADSLLTIIDPLEDPTASLPRVTKGGPLVTCGNQMLESSTQVQTVDEKTFTLEDVQLDSCINLGKLVITTKDRDGLLGAAGRRQDTFTLSHKKSISAMIRQATPSREFAYHEEPKLLWQINKGSQQGEVNGISGIALMENNDIIIIEWDNKRLQCFSSNGQSKSIVDVGNIDPQGVLVHQSGEIFITDGYTRTVRVYYYYNAHGVYSRTWRKEMFTDPCGIASLRNGDIAVCNYDSHTVSIHNPHNGDLITSFGNTGPDNARLTNPTFVCTDSHDQIIVTDDSDIIKIFDTSGKLLCNIRQYVSGKTLNEPAGVCVEHGTDSIIVAMCGDNSIVKFDADGRYIQTLLSEEDGVKDPWAVACGTDGNMVVAENRNVVGHHALKMFRLSYK